MASAGDLGPQRRVSAAAAPTWPGDPGHQRISAARARVPGPDALLKARAADAAGRCSFNFVDVVLMDDAKYNQLRQLLMKDANTIKTLLIFIDSCQCRDDDGIVI